jgi:flagellar hook-associated protein 3 FlgL
MTITRVTQNMLNQRSMTSVEGALTKMSAAQEQLSTGRRINRPSDDPTGTATAMQARASIAEQQQYQRNGQDGLSWLSVIDSTIQSMSSQVNRAYTLAVQGANSDMSGAAQDSLAAEVDQIKQDLLASSNTQYLGRPVFGGTTNGPVAYVEDKNTGTVSYVGDEGTVSRRVGVATSVQVNTAGKDVFGDPAVAGDSVFQHLTDLSAALRNGPADAIETSIGQLQSDLQRLSAASADEGARYNQISTANDTASAAVLALQKTQSDAEDVDVATATINVETQQTAYQAALMATSKTMQRSLLDFLS